MALIICPECGRQISDKAVSCPGCGFPMSELPVEDTRSDIEKLVDEIWERNPVQRVNAIKELQKVTGMDLKSAKEAMDRKYNSAEGKLVKDEVKRIRREEQKQASQDFRNAIDGLANLGKRDKTARCPKCRSTSISYESKRLSLGRAAVGGVLAGGTGAVLGGLTGKKGYAVCLNCGKRWKI